MSCLTQHKTKEELSDWLMNNASDNETTGFLDMLAGDIWDMMNAEEMSRDKVRELIGEHFHGERVSRNPEVSTSYTIYDWDSEEESEEDSDDPDEE